jgi:hypothetical protein
MENSSVPKSCTDLDPTLLYILTLGTYSKFELSRLKGLAQIRKRKKYGLVGYNIFVWEKFRIHSGVLRVARGGYAKPLAARPGKIKCQRSAFASRNGRAVAAGLPRRDHVWITTDNLFRFHTDESDELPCKRP